MNPIYLYVLIASLIIPALFSIFAIDFIKLWKNFIISTTVTAGLFLIWDVIFTHLGVWGFNNNYLLGYSLFLLPLEEWLFFMIIPFCSLFTHFAFYYKLPKLQLNRKFTIYTTSITVLILLILIVFNSNKAYTLINFIITIALLSYGLIYYTQLLQQFYITFIIILIPFFLVNGILTGAITPDPIVWYNNNHNLGIRICTIPIEDIAYAFSMLFGNLLIFEKLNTQQNQSVY